MKIVRLILVKLLGQLLLLLMVQALDLRRQID
jgi:hypothetical protein